MGTTAVSATMTRIGQLTNGVKIYTFTAADASAVDSTGAVITLPKVKEIVGNPYIVINKQTVGACVTFPLITATTTSGNTITTTTTTDSSTTSLTYTGLIFGR